MIVNHHNPTKDLKRCLGVFACTMLVVGNMIGVGIFTTPGTVAERLPSSGLILLAWILGCFLAIGGALSYAELGAAYPFAGGNYVFLREAYGSFWGFIYGWTAAFITQAGTVAVLGVGFLRYAGITHPGRGLGCAYGIIFLFGALNYVGVQVGSGSLSAITFLKVLSILALALAGALWGHGSLAHFAPVLPAHGGLWIGAALATSLIPIMYTYSGWNATVYVGSEVENPSRTIPLSLLLGVIVTASAYLVLNLFYLYALPVRSMTGVVAMASLASTALFSPAAAHLISGLIALSILGCINATLLTAPRIPYAMAQDGNFFPSFGNVHERYQTPGHAIILVTLWSMVLVTWGTFDSHGFDKLLDYVTVPSLLMNTLTVCALFVLRKTKPLMPRPYKAWGYPLLPASFVVMIIWIVVSELRASPQAAMIGLGIVSIGIPFYLYFRRFR